MNIPMTRRDLFARSASASALAIVAGGGLGAALAALPAPAVDRRGLLTAYREFLFFEERKTAYELWPGDDESAYRAFVPVNYGGSLGNEAGPPSRRAAAVLVAAGCDLGVIAERWREGRSTTAGGIVL